ncbi:MAG: UTRA domain-containing protein [Pseudomonadota bacterium]
MNSGLVGWRDVKAEVARRISSREWPPGSIIPAEVALANEFGCARATVNRALRELADTGLVERKRRAGTRVVEHPVRQARFSVPLIRYEIEQLGKRYAHRLLGREVARPPASVRELFGIDEQGQALLLEALHLADTAPYASEHRWVNIAAVPEVTQVDFNAVSANEWLVEHAPFAGGGYTVAAEPAEQAHSDRLNCKPGVPLVVVNRHTVDASGRGITDVRICYAVGHCLSGKF